MDIDEVLVKFVDFMTLEEEKDMANVAEKVISHPWDIVLDTLML